MPGASHQWPNGSQYTGLNQTGPWTYQLLPYIEQQNLYQMAAWSANAPNQTSTPVTGVTLKVFMDPGRGRQSTDSSGRSLSDYALNTQVFDQDYNNGNYGESEVRVIMTLLGIQDGTSNTIFVGEKALSTGRYNSGTGASWDDPLFWTGGGVCRGSPKLYHDPSGTTSLSDWGAPYASGAPFVMYDGSVRLIPYSASGAAPLFGALLTPSLGDLYTGP
jgi:hypothetical protein